MLLVSRSAGSWDTILTNTPDEIATALANPAGTEKAQGAKSTRSRNQTANWRAVIETALL
jgi:hypothetical protein